MKIQIISDLHVEENGLPDPSEYACDTDVMIVAGDVGPAPSVMPVLQHISQHVPGEVFYVPGNHEAYGLDKTLDCVWDFLEMEAVKTWDTSGPKIHMLRSGGAGKGDGVYLRQTQGKTSEMLMGDTLWTDFQLYDTFRNRRSQYYMEVARNGMMDYRHIKGFSPESAASRSSKAYHRMMESGTSYAREDGIPFVGVSHHLPTAQSISPIYRGSKLNPAFASNYDPLLQRKTLWVHGHTHTPCDYVHEPSGCRVVCNPKGYGNENPDFNPRLVIEV